jgi:hypothetical protein
VPHAQALANTSDPSTLAAQVVRRLAPEFETEWSAEAGFIRMPEGLCTFHSWPEGLRLDAFADTGDQLFRIEQFIAERFGSSGLRIDWRRRPRAESDT